MHTQHFKAAASLVPMYEYYGFNMTLNLDIIKALLHKITILIPFYVFH